MKDYQLCILLRTLRKLYLQYVTGYIFKASTEWKIKVYNERKKTLLIALNINNYVRQ